MIDAHCHLNFHKFENDYDTVIKDATRAGVSIIINSGTQVSSSQRAVDLAKKYDNLFAIIGVHPHHADKVTEGHPGGRLRRPKGSYTGDSIPARPAGGAPFQNDSNDWLFQLEQLAKHPKVIGIGECGMDYYNYQSNNIVDPVLQRKIFIQQIELSAKAGLPLQIHSRDEGARKEVIEILKTHKHLLQDVPGMFHCMAGSLGSLKEVLNMGFYVGIDGNSTYQGVSPGEPLELKSLIKYVPLDRIVIESDSPYLTPLPHRGKRNEPKYVIIIAGFVAKLKGVSFENLVEQTDKNVYTLFKNLKRL